LQSASFFASFRRTTSEAGQDVLTYSLLSYSLCFKIKVTFGHKLRYEIKVTFGEISLKLRQTNWNVARNNVDVVVDELSSQMTVYTC
jgi:hypothetical protein